MQTEVVQQQDPYWVTANVLLTWIDVYKEYARVGIVSYENLFNRPFYKCAPLCLRKEINAAPEQVGQNIEGPLAEVHG